MIIVASPCPGQVELLHNNTVWKGYTIATEGMVDPGGEVDVLFEGTGSLSVCGSILLPEILNL